MSAFSISLGSLQDDSDLRRILKTTGMQGSIRLGFYREPSFFRALAIEGSFSQVVVCREKGQGHLVGFGTRSVKNAYVNGFPGAVGYLGSLRLEKQYRNGINLARGYRFFRDLHYDNRTALYLTTIMADNVPAIRLLTSGKAGIPQYRPMGRFITKVISPGIFKHTIPAENISRCMEGEVEEVAAFLCGGSNRQFFPCYTPDEIQHGTGLLTGLDRKDVFICRRQGHICGVAGFWDQSALRQIVVEDYAAWLKLLRPIINCFAVLRRIPMLPPSGTMLRAGYLAFPVVARDDPSIYYSLLSCIGHEANSKGYEYMIAGFHENDPLCATVRGLPGLTLMSNVYLVAPGGTASMESDLDGRIPYLETGAL